MKEIDFLPEWYLQQQRRQVYMRRQYSILASIFLFMICWNAFAKRDISMASAELLITEPQRLRAEAMSEEYQSLRGRLLELQDQLDLDDVLTCQLDVPGIMSEIGSLASDQILLNHLHMKAQFLADPCDVNRQTNSLEISKQLSSSSAELLHTPKSFEIVIQAQTGDTEAMTLFLSALEDSPFFQQVYLRYIRSGDVPLNNQKISKNPTDTNVDRELHKQDEFNEFEIRCYVSPRSQRR